MTNKKNNKKPPAWARYNGEQYKAGFSGTPEQKKESDKAVAEFFAHRKGGKK